MDETKIDKMEWEQKSFLLLPQHIYGPKNTSRTYLMGNQRTNLSQIGKRDEEVCPLTEAELDEYLASAKECNLRKRI